MIIWWWWWFRRGIEKNTLSFYRPNTVEHLITYGIISRYLFIWIHSIPLPQARCDTRFTFKQSTEEFWDFLFALPKLKNFVFSTIYPYCVCVCVWLHNPSVTHKKTDLVSHPKWSTAGCEYRDSSLRLVAITRLKSPVCSSIYL